MGFVKLDDSILHSTIWDLRPDREVFLTACLLARPKTMTEEIPQLSIYRDAETGWKISPGEYGFAPVSAAGLVRAANLGDGQFDAGMAALERLGEPEEGGKSQAFEGRRVVRVDGGFLVLNLMKYRSKDLTAGDRSRRYRARKAAKKSKKTLSGGEWNKQLAKVMARKPTETK